MKRLSYILFCGLMFILSACEKDTESSNFAPVVTTGTASNIYRMGATLSGSIQLTETNTAKSYGILLSSFESMAEATEYPVKDGSSNYNVLVQNLEPCTTYYYCAYASSGYSIAKSQIKSFTTTNSNAPVFNEVILQSKDEKSCAVSTELLDEGGSELLMTGFVWGEAGSGDPTIKSNVVNVEPQGSRLSATIKGMEPNKTYLVRAYGVNAHGVGYSNSVSVTTNTATVPVLSDIIASDSTEVSVTVHSTIVDAGLGEVSKYGFCYSSESKNPTTDHLVVENIEGDSKNFSALIDGLKPETTYYIRAYAVNEKGTGYSEIVKYTTANITIPSLSNIIRVDSTEASVTLKSSIINTGFSEIIKFGFCYSSESNEPTTAHFITENIEGDTNEFSALIDDLTPETTYYIRAYAENIKGIGYSEVLTFNTKKASLIEGNEGDVYVEEAGGLSKFIDDTNKYNITKLKVSGYLNGDDIRLIRDMAGRDIDYNETPGRLVDLDISEATIVEGGGAYISLGLTYYFTSNNDVGKGMFYGTKLQNIILPDGVTSIGDYTFSGCSALMSITLPDGVTSIGVEAFLGCSSLTNINIPDGVTSIGDFAFGRCSSLTNITLPDKVTSIGDSAFLGCSSLTNINIPDGVTSIREYAFEACSLLENVTISSQSALTSIGYRSFYRCSSLTSINIPNGVIEIGGSAFFNCTSLTSIIIPDGVTSIERETFYGCESLVSISISTSVTYIGEYAFRGCRSLTKLIIPDSVTEIDNEAFNLCSALNELVIGKGVTTIGNGAFARCSSITEITIPDAVTSIEYSAFNGCSSLAKLIISDSVTHIGENVFEGCSALSAITLSNNITTINSKTFAGCTSLININIPNGVTKIGSSAFNGCTSLANINIPNGVTEIGDSAFSGCTSLANINIPNGVTEIGGSAFRGCTSLTSVNIPNSITSINGYIFYGCSAITNIIIPNGVTSIVEYAFYRCSSLSEVTCNATTPPTLSFSVFAGIASPSTLFIPAGCSTAYSESDWAQYFTTIEEK